MKQESTKKNRKVLWIILGAAALVAVAGVVLALVLGGFGNGKEPVGGRPDLYWNVARQSHVDADTGLSIREPAADGLYYVTFAYNGEHVEYPVADKKTVNFIDTMDIMGLVFDNDGVVVDAVVPKEAATEIGKSLYVQNSSKSAMVANSSIMMNGMRFKLRINELTEVYECTAAGEFEGVKVELDQLKVMDTIAVYANDKNEITHIFVINHPVESKVYWRKDFMWNWDTNQSSRVPDENGIYTIDFFCEGELVSLKAKDFSIVNQIDSPSRYKAHFGLVFDEEGYIVGQMSAGLASRTLLQANSYDITEFDGENYIATNLLSNDGSEKSGVLSSDCKVYDVSKAAIAEGRQGKQVESVQLGDRVCIWQNVAGEAVLVYVTNRMVDSPAYYVPERKYDSTTKETTRVPNAQGYYEIDLLREGDSEKTTYKTKDKALMTLIDKPIDKCVGLKLKDGSNEIEYVYEPECIFGYTHFRRGGYVSDVTGALVRVMDGSLFTMVDGVLSADCKVYNVSSVGEYGAETTLQPGDCVYGWKQPNGEVCHVYVVSRYLGTESMFYCVNATYDNTLRTTKKVPDEEGWYYLTFANQGKHVTYKTKDVKIVNSIEYLAAPAVALVLDGDVIVKVENATAATGGPRLVRDYKVTAVNGNNITVASDSGKTVKDIYLADDAEIYNVSYIRETIRGEKSTVKVGDTVAVWADWNGEGKIVMITARTVENLYWKTDRYYSYNKNSTTRKPDADGWYWFEVTTNGKVETVKTNDKSIATSIDYYQEAFAMHVVDGIAKGAVGSQNVKDCGGNGVTNWTITAINGKTVSLTYTLPGSDNTGKTQTLTLADNAKIYDVSGAAKSFGEKTTLKVGDVIRTYLTKDKQAHQYVYVRGRNTRAGGNLSYCEHCDKVVTWNPLMINASLSSVDGHYFLCGDTVGTTQLTVATSKDDIEVVVDLNGYTFENKDGRVASVREGDTLTILDSIGGGKMIGSYSGYDGGVVTLYGGGTINMYGGTLELTDNEKVKPYYGGVVYLYNSNTVFNMYGGTIRNGRSYARNEKCGPYGGNVYVQSGTFNMYGGTIENGKAFTDTVTVTNKDGSTSEKLMRGSGGNLYISSSAKVNIMGGSIVGGWVGDDGYGGNIYSASNKNIVNISNATVSGGHARRGGNFYGNGTGTWENASIIDGTASDRGANVMFNRGNFTLDGGTKIANGVAGDRGGNMVIYYGTVNFNKCSVDGGVAKKGIGGNMLVLFDAVINIGKDAVISNGTSATNGGNIYLQKNWDSDVMKDLSPIFNMNDGKIVGGTAETGDGIYVETGTVMNLTGGNIDGQVYLAGTAAVNISGDPTVKDIFLGKNLLTLDQMTGGKVGVTATGVFTKPVSDPAAYLDYFTAMIRGSKVDYTQAGELTVIENTNPDENPFNDVYEAAVQMTADNVFAGGGTVSAKCPYCDKEVQWTALEENTTGAAVKLSGGHYYLENDLNNNHRYTIEENTCLHLNGHNITANNGGSVGVRAFYVTAGTLSVMGDGQVKGSYKSSSSANAHFGSTVDTIGNLNLFGGTWLRGKNGPVIGGRPGGTNSTINIYEGTVIQGDSEYTGYALVSVYADHTFNMWGGKITGGTWEGGTGGNLYIWAGTKDYYRGTVNIYAGTIENGSAAAGGNIYAIGDVSPLTVNITGGNITGGSMFVAGNIDALNISGVPVVENLDLPNGSLATLGKLETGADVKVSAEGIFTAALDNANDYLQYVKSYDADMVVGVTAAGELTIAYGEIEESEAVAAAPGVYNYQGVCPCCGKAWDEITWTDIPAATNITSSYNIQAGGHYRLTGNRQYGRNASHAIRVRNAAGSVVTFDFNGYKIEATGTMGNERLFTVSADHTLNIVDSSAGRTGTARTTVTGANAIMNDGTLNIYGGNFELGANTSANGGLIHHRGVALNIYGGKFDAGVFSQTEKNGGAIYASKPLTIHNAYIVGGNARFGGAVYADNTSLTIAGGYIEGSVAAIGSGAKVTLSGSPILTCLDMESDGAVTSVTCNGLTKGASIRIAAPEGLIFTRAFASAETAAKFADYFSVVGYADVQANAENRLYVTGEKLCPHCGQAWDSITWNAWSFARATKGAVTSGHYYLTADDSAANAYYIAETSADAQAVDVCLDLNGYDLASTNSRVFYIYSGNSLSVINSAAGNAALISKNNVDGGNVWVSSNATLKVYDCALKNNAGGSVSANVEGGLISAGNGSVVELVGCALTAPNKGIEDGGALYAQDGSQVTMTNCVITAKKVDKTGSAIAIDKGTVTLNDCYVIGGTALENGTAIAMNGGTLVANGGVIYGGDATEQNKAVYTAGSAQLELNGCQVLLNVQAAAPVSPITMFKAWFRNLFQI